MVQSRQSITTAVATTDNPVKLYVGAIVVVGTLATFAYKTVIAKETLDWKDITLHSIMLLVGLLLMDKSTGVDVVKSIVTVITRKSSTTDDKGDSKEELEQIVEEVVERVHERSEEHKDDKVPQ